MNLRKPVWLRKKTEITRTSKEVLTVIDELKLHTVCLEANCPNQMECHARGTATFLILGRNCTRNCTFCNVERSEPDPFDPEEPKRVAEAVKRMGLKHAVITSVTRDDLPDGGAGAFRDVILEIRKLDPKITVEVLIPDLKGDEESLRLVVDAKPDVLNHNVETVPSLYSKVRPMADFERSLSIFRMAKNMDPSILTKSGMMLGLGETTEEVLEALKRLKDAGCDLLTLGQYLRPSERHIELVEYITPEKFLEYKEKALEMGFKGVESGPFVRSSYHAEELL
ncbi:lipoyl synthase [Guggenheimella bovis]